MRVVARELVAQGYEITASAAKFLKEIANQLSTQIDAVNYEWGDFLLEILSLTERSNGNQEEVYSFLEGKEDKLNIDVIN